MSIAPASLGWPAAPGAGPLGDGRCATAVLRPTSIHELCDVVRSQAEAGLALYPQGGRTGLDYGSVPSRPGVAIDVTGLDQVIDYPHADMTITVQAGIGIRRLQELLKEQGQRLLFDVPQADYATLGGALATGVCGPRRYGQGRPRDSIIGVSFVTSSGVEVKGGGRVVKNVAGYDFPKLLTGSLGSLGVITQATLKVRPLPAASALIWLCADGPEHLDRLAASFNSSAVRPVALDFLNPSASLAVGEPCGLEGGRWTLVVGIEDEATSVAWQVDRFRSEVGRDFEVVRDEASRPLWSALTDFQVGTPGPFACSASLRPSKLATFLRAFPDERWALQAHAGVGAAHLQATGDWCEVEAGEVVDDARRMAVAEGGNLTIVRCPTAWKPRLRVWGEPRPDWALGREVKRALDPIGLMNPGRFVGKA